MKEEIQSEQQHKFLPQGTKNQQWKFKDAELFEQTQ